MLRSLRQFLAWFLVGAFPLIAAAQAVTPPPVAAKAFVLVDLLSGQTLAAAAEGDHFAPGSLTKLMTAYVVFGAIRDGKLDPNATVTISESAAKAGGARMFVKAGSTVRVGDLLRGMVVEAANDATLALVEAVAGNEAAFVERMNREAARLGLRGTHYANATGEPMKDHEVTARDVALLAAALVRDFPDQYALFSQKEFTYDGMTQANRNRLLWTDPTVDGLQTAFTESSGYGLAASARRGGRRLVSVVLGAQSDGLRTAETQKLLNFGFQAYDTRRVFRKDEPVATPRIYKGTQATVKLGFDHDVWLSLPRDRFTGLSGLIQMRQPFVA
ncbi:MAG TPA: D-alanyl-D-alanine carboxypeptidase family protein, partial [Usitatibacter sp.]|nr:D-alanyl-D-alanine carboxypeptidase family protein [Usitatibacter sp.]